MGVVLDLLAECVGKAREPAHVHPHREILALHIGGADVLPIGLAFNPRLDGTRAFGWAIAARRAGRIAIELDELGVIHGSAERALYGIQIRLETVRSELDPIG